jgi:hypothetical protein
MNCARRDVFLLLEPVADYSPVAPVLCARRYGRDCQFNEGHELGRIPAEELLQTRVGAWCTASTWILSTRPRTRRRWCPRTSPNRRGHGGWQGRDLGPAG